MDDGTDSVAIHRPLEGQSSLLPGLPDDVALICMARVPPAHYPTFTLVSKLWNSVVRTPRLHTIRSNLGCKEQLLYLNLRVNSSSFWYFQKRGYRGALSPLPPIPTDFQPVGPACAVVGTKIYVVGGSINNNPSDSMWVFDCRFNKWEIGPKMKVCREFTAAAVVNGKIYVIGGCVAGLMNFAEVFDPITEVWSDVPTPIEVRDKWMHICTVIDSKVYAMAYTGGFVFDVETAEWTEVPRHIDLVARGRVAVLDEVMYSYDSSGRIKGYIADEDEWKELKGIDFKFSNLYCGAALVNSCGRLCVVWKEKRNGKEVEIMCAEIEVWKDVDGGLNGCVLWSDLILVVPERATIVHCLPVSL